MCYAPGQLSGKLLTIIIINSSSWIFFSSTHFPVFFFLFTGQLLVSNTPSSQTTEVPNYHHCLPQPSMNPLHIISSKNPLHIISSNPTIIQKTASSKERGSSSSTHCRDFLFPSTHLPVFFLPDTQASFCDPAIVINQIPKVPKLSSLSPSILKQPATHHFIKPHHFQKTVPSNERGSSSLTCHRAFLPLFPYVFYTSFCQPT
jgi:hypothetical protein